MNVTALLSFYDEDPAWLERCIRSLPRIGVKRLICLDGAYALLPGGEPKSPADQYRAIILASAGMDLHIACPDTVWAGNEIEKRNHLFELAEQSPADWYFVIDADEAIVKAPTDVPSRLQAIPSTFDVAGIKLHEPGHPLGTYVYPTHPKFFRAIPGLRCVDNHYTYTTPDGRKLWGHAKRYHIEPRVNLGDEITVTHYRNLRHEDRREQQKAYYTARDAANVESLPANRSHIAA